MMLTRIRLAVAVACISPVWSTAVRAQTIAQLQVAPATAQVEVGAREGVLVTAYDAGGNVVPAADFVWSSSNEGVARVEPDAATPNIAYVVGLAPGTAMVAVAVGSAEAVIAVTVLVSSGPSGVGQAVSLQILPNPIQLLPTEEIPLETRFLRADGALAARGALTWRSLLEAVAAVDQRGSVIGISAGQGVIEATGPNGIVARVVVQVANEGFQFDRNRLFLSPAEADSVAVIVPGQNGRRILGSQLRWAATNSSVVSVTPSGVITAISAGSADVVVQGFGQQQRLSVTVHRRVGSMDFLPRADQGPIILPLTGTVSFEATFYDASDTPVTEAIPSWTIQDPSIVSFDETTGVATGLQIGTTQLSMQGPSGLEASWELEVVGGSIALDRKRVGLSVGGSVNVPASFVGPDGNRLAPAVGLTWTTSSVDVATVDGSGTVSGTGWGGTQVVASASWGAADTLDVFVQGEMLVTKFPGGGGDIYAFDPGSPTEMNQLTSGPNAEIGAIYSPDGSQIAYVAAGPDGTQKVFVMDADGSNPRMLTNTPMREGSPAFTPDASQIVFEADSDIWIMNADGTNPRQLTSGEAVDNRPAVSPDGTMIAYQSTPENNSDIFVMSIDGSGQRALATTESHETVPAWFPDGRLGYVSSETTGRDRTRIVMRLDMATGDAEPLSPVELRALNFAVSGDGNTLALVVEVQEDRNLIRKLFMLPVSGPGAGTPVEVSGTDPLEQFFFPSFRPGS